MTKHNNSSTNYLIKHGSYSGPIQLILELVQSKKVDIYAISIDSIIEGFLEYIKDRKNILIETLSSFLYTASVLLEIKSRSLIPSKKQDSEDNGEIDEEILRKREKEYRIFKKISFYFEKKLEIEDLYYLREAPIEKKFINLFPNFLEGISAGKLAKIAANLLKSDKFQLNVEEIYNHRDARTIHEEMGRIKNIIKDEKEVTFKQLSLNFDKVIDKIICFLSILELYKNEIIDILQFENFGNIIIKKR